MSTVEPASVRACPKCEAVNAEHAVTQDYRCTSCGFELAHLDIAANGAIRGVFGWLRAAGDTIQDRYRVRSVLGKGGFGATYLVDDLRLNGKRRALKEVPELLFDEYETALLSRLQHPSIPDIIDRFTAGGMVYLTLEFGGSRTLASERNRQGGRIPFATLLPWMRQLCMVLSYLHTQDPPIIHRDLKPENILLDEGGRIMLIDFGIAKEATPSGMTRTLGRAATHGFSPPEQVMGTGTDQRSDVYALGATCYALLTGESPPAAHERVAGKELRPPGELSPAGTGSLYLTDGALEFARTESELAAILAHEMGHQISGHFCPRERPSFFSWLFGRSDDMAATSRNDVHKKDLGAISLVIDPLKEQEADRQAVAILREAGYDPHAMLDVARRLPSGGRPSHLQNPRRIQSLETSLATLPSIEIDESQAFQAAKRYLEAELRGW